MLTINTSTREIRVHRNTDARWSETIRDSAGNLLDVAGASFKLTVRNVYDGTILFQLASPAANGIDLAQGATGVILLKAPRAVLGVAGSYIYDLQMTLAGDVELPAGVGQFIVLKDVTGTGAAPVVVAPLQFLEYLTFAFPGQLQAGDILTQELNLARTALITIRQVHVDAALGPVGGDATFAFQDHPTAPTLICAAIVPAGSGSRVAQEFDADATPATFVPFVLTPASGRKLTLQITTANLIEDGAISFGFTYA